MGSLKQRFALAVRCNCEVGERAQRRNWIKALQEIVSKSSQKPHSLMRYAELPTLTHTNAPAFRLLNAPFP